MFEYLMSVVSDSSAMDFYKNAVLMVLALIVSSVMEKKKETSRVIVIIRDRRR